MWKFMLRLSPHASPVCRVSVPKTFGFLTGPSGKPEIISLDRSHPDFKYFACGLGKLGVVCHVLLRLVPQMTLSESIEVLSRQEVLKGHAERLRGNRHVTYHWYPYTNDCIVKRINVKEEEITNGSTNGHSEGVHLKLPTRDKPDFAAEREKLLGENPCDRAHVSSVNHREVAYYRKACADKVFVGNSTDVLTFKCGGSQHVNEVCGKTYAIDGFQFSAHSELDCVLTMLSEVESRGIPAPGEFS